MNFNLAKEDISINKPKLINVNAKNNRRSKKKTFVIKKKNSGITIYNKYIFSFAR